MKKLLLLTVFIFLVIRSFSQWGYGFINFDNTTDLFRISIDTSVPNNIWQIGAPHKSFFTSSHSKPNAIVTDTLIPYPVNNNSVFFFRTSGDYNTKSHDANLGFWYKMDCDTLLDFGRVAISIDTGRTWQNLTTGYVSWTVYDSLYNLIESSYNSNDTLVFTGRTNGWHLFSCDVPVPQMVLDSIIYRFTFHSTNLSIPRDGWMIDDIQFNTVWESTPEKELSCKVYPNPVRDQMTLNSKILICEYEILTSSGCIVKIIENNQIPVQINVSDLQPGLYFYKIKFVTGQESFRKFVKI